MPSRKRSQHFQDLAEKRWEKRKLEENNDSTGVSDIFETDKVIIESESEELPKPNFRIKTKFEEAKNEIKVENECQYALIDLSQLNHLLQKAKCIECNETSLIFEINKTQSNGFAMKISLLCEGCKNSGLEEVKSEIFSSKHITNEEGYLASFDVNYRMAAAFLYMGKGYAGIQTFGMFLNLHAFSQSTFDKYLKKLDCCVDEVTERLLKESRSLVKNFYVENKISNSENLETEEMEETVNLAEEEQEELEENVSSSEGEAEQMEETVTSAEEPSKEKLLDVCVSYDGSWLTRGYKSNHGVGCAIDIESGFVIDYNIMTKHCQICAIAAAELGEDSPEYEIWHQGHEKLCEKNHNGSSASMEIAVAEKIWKRSADYGFRFTKMISDGDAKTFNHLVSLNIYGEKYQITKEDCINHVGKRLYTRVNNVVKEERARKVTLGGRGRGQLKKATIEKLAEYYKKAIYRNKNDVDGMRNAIFATIYHAVSTDKKPQHSKCPVGSSSWCFYQAAKAKKQLPGPHDKNVHTPLNKLCFKKILPVYNDLTKEDLLIRCSRCFTQNANESLHSVIWSRCPKEIFVGKSRVKIAVCLAICEYNFGSTRTVTEILKQARLPIGHDTVQLARKIDSQRLARGIEKSNENYKKARHIMAVAKNRREEKLVESEGVTYGAGMF